MVLAMFFEQIVGKCHKRMFTMNAFAMDYIAIVRACQSPKTAGRQELSVRLDDTGWVSEGSFMLAKHLYTYKGFQRLKLT